MRIRLSIAIAVIVAAWPLVAEAQPLRLRGDVFVSAEPPVGLLILQGEDRTRPWIDAEALVWTGASELDDSGTGDALVIAVRMRDPDGRGEARVGRFLVASGAIRPLHIDGAAVRAHSGWGTDLEVFGGLPVVPEFGVDAYDWVTGARVSHRIDDLVSGGLSYYHRRDDGFLADEEVGVDVAGTPTEWLDLAARAAYDTVHPGIADAHVSAAARRGKFRYELFGARRSPSRLLPATSLFAALGDVPSSEVGAGTRWRAAPRLDVWANAAVRWIDGDVGVDATARAALRLDDKGAGSVGLELRRSGVDPISSWTGARATCRVPLNDAFTASAEVELAVPDDSRDRGTVWPWGLAAITWSPTSDWEAAAAIEGRATPEHDGAISGMLRIARRWGTP